VSPLLHASQCCWTVGDHHQEETALTSELTTYIDEQKFADLFTTDGVYEFAGEKNTGRAAILAFRESLFSNIAHRDHPVVKVYSFGSNDLELMVLGEVTYVFGDEGVRSQEWAGRYTIVEDDAGGLKFKPVQIFTVSIVLYLTLIG
jgi:uncharacterized protein (TIGR02246 family)